MKGFKIYEGLEDVTYCIPKPSENKTSDVKSEADKIFDLIFAKDSNGWPCSSVAAMLSDKTSDDVRKFIQDNLVQGSHHVYMLNDEKLIGEFNKQSSEFLAKVSRNRFESVRFC